MQTPKVHSKKGLTKSSKLVIIAASAMILTAWAVALAVIFFIAPDSLEARIIEIFSVDGQHVDITRGTSAVVTARAGARLHDGYGVVTGVDSICHIRLDADSLVRMDSDSRISVNRVSATTLSILVEYGQILIDMLNQHPEHEMEVQVGNAVVGVRGTLFIAGLGIANEVQVIMLEGNVYVEGHESLSAGYVMMLQDTEPPEVRPLMVQDLDEFAWQAILDYRDRVIDAKAITLEELEWIIRRMDVPDYIWIQDLQLSTAITDLHFTTDIAFAGIDIGNIYIVNLTDEDIRPLAYMANLTHLRINNQNVSDITPLSGLVGLRSLHIDYNQISDISPLAELTNLTTLWINGNKVNDISPLAGLTNLRSLSAWGNNISDISPLAGLMNLEILDMGSNPITDWTPTARVQEVRGR